MTRGLVTKANFLQFEHKGQTATLKTAADIATWIAERKKKYPTLAKADAARKEEAEKKQKWEEEKKQRGEAAKEKRLEREKNRREAEELRWRLLNDQKMKQQNKITKNNMEGGKDTGKQDEDHALSKARLKAEKLRRKAEKVEIKAIKAEATARIARVRRWSSQRQDSSEKKECSIKDGDSAIMIEDHVELRSPKTKHESHMALKEHEDSNAIIFGLPSDITTSTVEKENLEDGQISSNASSSSLPSISDSSDISESDLTSSCGSSSSDSDSDSAPEQKSTKRTAPDRVLPRPRKRRPCRNVMKFGKCRYGIECPFSHEIPERSNQRHARTEEAREKKERRKGLWQVMVDKELEEERKQVLRAIVFMGEKGVLDEDKAAESSVKVDLSGHAKIQGAEREVKATASEDAMIQAAAAKGIMT